MIRASLLILVVAVTVAGGAQAVFEPFEECTESIYDGPLKSHTPIN